MPDGDRHSTTLESSRDRMPPVHAGPSTALGVDQAIVAARIDRIMSLIAAGYLRDAREACADLVFDSQPLIVARAESYHRLATALRRCDGHQLLRRLAIAADGGAA